MNAAIGWTLLAGAGLLMLLTAQPYGRRRPSLAERMERLRPDTPRQERPPAVFSTPGADVVLLPILRGLGSIALRAGQWGGLPTARLQRRLLLAGENPSVTFFLGQKVLLAILGFFAAPLLALAGASVAGSLPAWSWLGGAALGFLAPDFVLASKVARRSRELIAGIGAATEFLALAVSAGLGLEQALVETAKAGEGPFFNELSSRLAKARLTGERSTDALARFANETDLPELVSLVGALDASAQQGTPLLDTLRAQASAARERERIVLVTAAQRAQVTMLFPVVGLILPSFFLIVLFPVAVGLLRLAAP